LALHIDGQKIDNKTSTLRLPKLSDTLKRKLVDRQLTSFGSLKKSCRANDGAFKSLLIALGATGDEVGFLVSIIRQGQTMPPGTPRPQQPSA
jgi:hypothetical protein